MNASALFSRMQLSAKRILESTACLGRIGLGRFSGASGLKLDIKTSSHKTLKTLISHLSDRSLLSSKTVRNELVVTSIRFENPAIKSFVPPVAAVQESTNSTLVQVNTWYALNKAWTAVFPTAPADGSRKDFADIIQGYLKESCKGASMELTDALRTALGTKDFTMEKREITKRFSDSLVQLFSLSTELPPKVRKGVPPTITVTVKRIQGSKYATFVSGLSKYCLNEDDLVQVMARAFSVSVSVGDSDIYCQGNLSSKLVPWLVSVVGIPK
jgi:translation initiation factor 1 (eIF-1/SUI1)